MKSKFLLSLLAALPAVFLPLAATGQIAPERPVAEPTEVTYKYEAFAGFGYTSLNQVNQSRHGLMGADLALTRNLTKHFGLTADGAFYNVSAGSGNPGTPSVDAVLFGPVVRGTLFRRLDCFAHVLLGGEHVGGESMTPTVSLAGGYGVGMDYKLTPRFNLRVYGDDIFSSFSVRNNSSATNYSSHETSSSRAAVGIVYKF